MQISLTGFRLAAIITDITAAIYVGVGSAAAVLLLVAIMIVVVIVSTPVVKSDRKKGITMSQYIGLFPQDIICSYLFYSKQ